MDIILGYVLNVVVAAQLRIVLLYRYSIRIDGCGRADPVTAVRKCQAPLHQPRLRSLTVRCFTFTPGAMLHNYEVH